MEIVPIAKPSFYYKGEIRVVKTIAFKSFADFDDILKQREQEGYTKFFMHSAMTLNDGRLAVRGALVKDHGVIHDSLFEEMKSNYNFPFDKGEDLDSMRPFLDYCFTHYKDRVENVGKVEYENLQDKLK